MDYIRHVFATQYTQHKIKRVTVIIHLNVHKNSF